MYKYARYYNNDHNAVLISFFHKASRKVNKKDEIIYIYFIIFMNSTSFKASTTVQGSNLSATAYAIISH